MAESHKNSETRITALELIARKMNVPESEVEAEISRKAVDAAVIEEIESVRMHIREQKILAGRTYEPTEVEIRTGIISNMPALEP